MIKKFSFLIFTLLLMTVFLSVEEKAFAASEVGLITNESGLNVRSGPSTTYPRIGGVYKNDKVEIVGQTGDWYKIIFKTGYGYINKLGVQIGTYPPPPPSGYTFGSDSATSTNPYGNDFYLGQLGLALREHFNPKTGGDDAYNAYFNRNGALNAKAIYGYWFLSGMSKNHYGYSAYNWGAAQAKLALKAYQDMKNVYKSKVRPVLFIDAENGGGSLDKGAYKNNQSIYKGFVDYINKYGKGIKPGTYSSTGDWGLVMGNFKPLTPGYYWLASYPYSSAGIPKKEKLTTSYSLWKNFPYTSEKPIIYQYWGYGHDYNVARKLP